MHVGELLRETRESLGLTRRQMAELTGLGERRIAEAEASGSMPAEDFCGPYRARFGFDPHTIAWCRFGDPEKLPASVRDAARKFTAGLEATRRERVATFAARN